MIPFFFLVFVLSVPFWVAGALLGDLPGSPMDLPVGALQFPCPLIAAAILLRRSEGAGAVRRLLRTTFAAAGMRRGPWLVTAFLMAPVIDLAAYALAVLVGGPLGGEHSPLLAAPLLFAVFFVAAACEEAGWTGYATGPLLDRREPDHRRGVGSLARRAAAPGGPLPLLDRLVVPGHGGRASDHGLAVRRQRRGRAAGRRPARDAERDAVAAARLRCE